MHLFGVGEYGCTQLHDNTGDLKPNVIHTL
jgi:hypothetical protein